MGYILQQKAHGTVDASITIKDGADAYIDTPENFETDYGSAFPSLGADQYVREYEQGIKHSIFDEDLKFDAQGDLNWALGDTIISSISSLITAKEAREYVAPTLEEAKETGKRLIDSKAGNVRKKYITSTHGQEMTYLEKAKQAEDFINAGYPADTSPYPFIEADMTALSLTKEQAADGIIAQRDAWLVIGATVEQHRLAGKAQVDTAADLDAIDTVVEDTSALLDTV